MINQLNVDVSLPVDVNVKPLVDCAVIDTWPGVPPVVARLNKITLDAVQAVVATVTAPGVPDIAADTPTEALEPAAIKSLLPIVARLKLPFVAVILPAVAVIEPGAVKVLGTESVVTPALVEAVIWFAVPKIELIAPDEPANCTQLDVVTLLAVD
jgi:hypothetical protein